MTARPSRASDPAGVRRSLAPAEDHVVEPAEPSGRQRLLDRVVDHMLDTGTATSSLRALASEIGSSHRMLIYHFGGQEGLVAAVVGEVERRQQVALTDLVAVPGQSMADQSWAFWKRISSPKLAAVERLFFLLYARLIETGDLVAATRMSSEWLERSTALLAAGGVDRARARRISHLGLAVYRGLILDLLATGDRRGADAAMRLYNELVFGEDSP